MVTGNSRSQGVPKTTVPWGKYNVSHLPLLINVRRRLRTDEYETVQISFTETLRQVGSYA